MLTQTESAAVALRVVLSSLLFASICTAEEPTRTNSVPPKSAGTKRVLLLGQRPDGHPSLSHEYMAGVRLLAKLIQNCSPPQGKQPQQEGSPEVAIQTIVVQADGPWEAGPELLEGADGAVLFLSEGAKWLSADPNRLAAFQRLAKRRGGLVVLHWGMGTRETAPVANFTSLFGLCHGGPDRKYKVLTTTIQPSSTSHLLLNGLREIEVHDEFYYSLKRPESSETIGAKDIVSIVRVHIDNEDHTVGWAWERPDGGRSFGFSGLHFHDNWKHVEYRRLVLQGVVWSLGMEIPAEGLPVEVKDEDLVAPPQPGRKKETVKHTESKPQPASR